MQLNGAQMVIEALKMEGVDTVFGYPGGAALPLYDALYESDLNHILPRHEQGAVHAADGYARVTGKVGVCFATSGPGATNLITGIANAQMDSVPMVCITCQVTRAQLGRDSFQESDILGITTPITKHNFMVRDIARLPRILRKSFYLASTGRPGPVVVDIPKDVFFQTMDWEYPTDVSKFLWGYKAPVEGNLSQLKEITNAIERAHFPLLFVGGGVVGANATEELRKYVEMTGIPVVSSLMGMSALPTTHPSHLGMVGMHGTFPANKAIMHTDMLIGLGVRFSERVTSAVGSFAPSARIAQFDIDPAEFNKNVKIDFRVQGDLKWSLPHLIEETVVGNIADWQQTIQGWKQDYPLTYEKNSNGPIKPQEVLEAINDLVKGDAIFATDVGQHQMWSAQYLNIKHPRSFITSGGLGTMGYGLPAAMGAQIGCPDKEVWLISSDGSIMMNCQEMATVAEHQLPIRAVILNNRGLGMVRQWQRMFFNNHMSQSRHEYDLDFAKLAEVMGCTGILVEKREDLLPALEKARTIKGPVFLNIMVDEKEDVLPMVAPGKSLNDMVLEGGDY